MREDHKVRQIDGERKRRWFYSDDFDLIVWQNADHTFAGFELCYDKRQVERAIVYRPGGHFEHMSVDDGEQRPGKFKSSPILVSDGFFDARRVHSALARECLSLPADVAEYVLQTLEAHPNYRDDSELGHANPLR